MGTKINHDCQGCSKLKAADARKKRCWDDKLCHSRRSYWRNQDKVAIARKQQRQVGDSVEELGFEVEPSYYLHVDFYRDRKLDPLRAIAIEVRKGSKVVLRQKPIDCLGMSREDIRSILKDVRDLVNQKLQLNLSRYSSRAELSVTRLQENKNGFKQHF
jgi:hypothetical protein